MPLTAGTRIGSYEILSAIGAGGMGEVYRARDTKLNRDVAIKALPESLSADSERVARFQREAQVLASLNHPHIASIYGVEETPTAKFLVLEFVDGQSLADHLTRSRALPLSEALPIARQILEALEAAHEKGIIHRDLKPANIMLTTDGQVKVLDFGLARVIESDPSSSVANSPTLTFAATQIGVILGTAAYMAPEQAKGRVADRRCDVWAFGCVFFEMLTGRRVFDGEDVSDTLAAVLRADPDWSALPADLPVGIRTLLKRCLERDRKMRVPEIAAVRFLLEDALAAPPAAAPVAAPAMPVRRGRTLVIAAASLAVGVALTAGTAWAISHRTPAARAQPMRFDLGTVLPVGPTTSDRQLTISPDGTRIAYISGGSTNGGQLVIRAIDRLEPERVSGITAARSPFFSPDSQWIGYFQANELKKVSVTGGPPIPICSTSTGTRGATWGADNTIVFATNDPSTGLLSVSAGGGTPKTLTTPAAGEVDHVLPSMLPNGRGVLFTIIGGAQVANAQVAVLDFKTGQRKTLVRGGSQGVYVGASSGDGYLVYAAAGTLRAVRFDAARYEVLGDPVPVVEAVASVPSGASEFAVSETGALTYVPGSASAFVGIVGGGAPRSLVWVNRQGREEPIKVPPRAFFNLRLSPDGTRVALDIRDQESDVWVWDLARQTLTRLTVDPSADLFPIWTPDSRRIFFSSARTGGANVYSQAADGTGTPERVTTAAFGQYPTSMSPDGARLILNELRPSTNADISVMALDGKSPPVPLLQTTANERTGEISPDGRWLAYVSDESGKDEVWLRPFPDVNSSRVQISTAGGTKPAWAPNGRELFYIDGGSFLTSVSIVTTPVLKPGNPVKLFEARNITTLQSARFYDVSRDGQRFIMIKELPAPPGTPAAPPIVSMVVVLNWVEELKARVGAK